MRTSRAAVAIDPRRFGRARPYCVALPEPRWSLSDDAKLFAATFAAGFLFVSILIG